MTRAPQTPAEEAAARRDSRNAATLFGVSILIGLGGAIYEVALPLFLSEAGLTWQRMGVIYGLASAATFVARVGFGAWSDRVGRKVVYVFSLLFMGTATLLTPLSAAAGIQALLKSVTDPMSRVREIVHSVLLYEAWPKGFQRIFSRTRAVEFLFHFAGLLVAAAALGWMARRGVRSPHAWFIAGAAVLLLASGLLFGRFYREGERVAPPRPVVTWRSLFRLHLERPMWVLTIAFFVFNAGITISHCFALQLFFQEKFGASDVDIFTIGALHRLSSGLVLLFFGHAFRRRFREWLMLFLVLEGIFLAAPGFMPAAGRYTLLGLSVPALWTAVVVWMAHDFLGMGLWLPIQQTLMQEYSRPDSRGEDIGLSTAVSALGSVPAPFLAGWLRHMPGIPAGASVNLPFIASGVGVALAAVVLLWLPKRDAASA